MEQDIFRPTIGQEQNEALDLKAMRISGNVNPLEEFLSFHKQGSISREGRLSSSDLSDTVKNELSNNLKNHKYRRELFDIFVEFWCSSISLNLRSLINNVEKTVIIKVLEKVNGNQRIAAKYLGMSPTTLNEKLKKYGICFKKAPVIDK